MTYTGDVIAKTVVTSVMVPTEAGFMMTGSVTMTIAIVVVMVVVMVPRVIPIGIIPAPMVAIPVVGAVPVVVVIPIAVVRIVIRIVVGIIVGVAIRIESPVPTVTYINIGIASTVAGVIVVVIIHGRTGACAETLDAGGEVLIIVGFSGGVNHAVGVGYCFGSLIYGVDIGLVVLAVGVIRLIVIGGVAADSGGRASAACGVLPAGMVVGRVVSVVVGHLFVGGASNGHETCHQYRNYSNCFHFVMYFDLISYFCSLKKTCRNIQILYQDG